jgi:transposase
LRGYRDDVLRFLTEFTVPFTNNQAERDLRMMKLRMKISGTFRTLKGAQVFADLRSVISTVRKLGDNISGTLALSTKQIIARI